MVPLVFAYGLKAKCYSLENVNRGSTPISPIPYKVCLEVRVTIPFYPNPMRIHMGHFRLEDESNSREPGYIATSKTALWSKHENRARPHFRQRMLHCTQLGFQRVNSGVEYDYEPHLSVFLLHSYRNHLNRAHKKPRFLRRQLFGEEEKTEALYDLTVCTG